MNPSQYEFFCVLSDVVLLKYDRLTTWEKNFISGLLEQAFTNQPISLKQKQLALKISSKISKK
ncbi:hypothetical protein BA953_22740 [Vibrio coralliilyticus]|nr:hypothetical protein BA953_22740 [Vibrio coralliilyticus]